MNIEFRKDTRGWTDSLIYINGMLAGDVSVNGVVYLTEYGEEYHDDIMQQLNEK